MSNRVRSVLRRPFGAIVLAGTAVAAAWLAVTLVAGAPPASSASVPARGYWLAASDGGVFGFGDAKFFGSTGALTLNRPIVGMAATPSGNGYWLVASDGGIFGFGDAAFHGSTGALTLARPIVGMAATPTGKGYWLVASDGGVFGFGDAKFFGSTGAIRLNRPIVGMAATPSGNGYWLVASDGGIFGFGDAAFHGSTGALPLAKPMVGMAATPSGKGYWLVASDGGVFGFGDARFLGSTGAIRLNQPIVAMTASPTGNGYWLVASDGGIFNFGDAAFFGSTGAIRLNRPIVGMAPAPGLLATDTVLPTVTVNQAPTQADPTNSSPVNFSVQFSEVVAGFTGSDVVIGGTAGGTKTAVVTGTGTTYNVAVSGMTSGGTVTVTVPANSAIDGSFNPNLASTSTDNTVTWDNTAPTVTVNQASAQADPTNTSPVNFTVVFSEAVTGFASADVTVGGTAGGTKAAAVTGSGTTYNVAVSGMTTDGTVTLAVPAAGATDATGNTNAASTSTDNSVTWDATGPTATVTKAASQADPATTSPVNFTVVFSEAVTGFVDGDVTVGGGAGGTKTATVTGSGATYNVAVSGMTSAGTVTASVGAGQVTDGAGNPNTASTVGTVTWDGIAPTVSVNQAGGQTDPANTSPINFTVVFSEAVTGFVDAEVTLGGTAGGTLAAAVTGSGTTYNVAVSGMTTAGTVTASVGAGVAADGAGNTNSGSTSTDNSVTWDGTAPTVTDVTSTAANGSYKAGDAIPVTVTFSESVVVTGTPSLALSTGAVVSFTSGSGTDTLTFNYTVGAGENSTDLDYASTTALALAGGTIRDLAGNNADLTLASPGAAGSLGANKNIVIDTTAPTVAGVTSSTANGTYKAGDTISIQVLFSESVAVTGTPTLVLNSGGTATYASGSASNTLTFSYTVASGHNSADLDYSSTSALGLNGATIRDLTGNNAALTLPTPGAVNSLGANENIVIDTAAPTVTGVTSTTADGFYNAGDTISIRVGFGEAVTVTGAPMLSLSSGGTASYTSGSGTTSLTFTYTVGSGQNSADLDYASTSALGLNGGTMKDAAGNDAVLTLPTPGAAGSLGANENLVVDTTAPTFDSIEATMGSTTVTATFSEAIDCSSVTAADFLATVAGNPVAVNAANCTGGTDTMIDLTLSSAPLGGATVVVSLVDTSGSVTDQAGNAAPAAQQSTSASTDVTVTIDQAGGQADPTNTGPINFTVVFSESVTGFVGADVTVGGTAGGTKTATVTGSGTTYNVAVNGMTTSGTVTASIPAGAAADGDGNASAASTSTDNTVTWDVVAPTATVSDAGGQADPTNTAPINFTVVFSEPVTGFADGDVTLGGTAGGTLAATVTGSGTTYNVAVNGMTTSGTVTVSVGAGTANDAAGNGNTVSNTGTVTWDVTAPTVTIDQAGGQADPANTSPINFTVVFSETVTGFADGDVTLGGTAGATTAVVTGSGTTYNVAVSGMTTDGTVTASVSAGAASDAAGNTSAASTSTDNTVTWDTTAPTVTVDQAAAQPDPDNTAPVNFTVVFSEATTNFVDADVTISGTAGGTKTATVTGSGTTYNVAVNGMTTPGTVIVSLNAGVATDGAGNGNLASTSTDNTVAWDATAPTVSVAKADGQADPANAGPINFTVVFSEPVTGFADGDVIVGGTSGGTKTASVTGSGTTYNVAVTGMTTDGTVTVSLAGGVAADAAGNGNTASNTATVAWDATDPALDHLELTYGTPNLLVVFSEPVLCSTVANGDFLVAVEGSPVAVSSSTCTGASDDSIEVVLAGAPGEGETLTVSLLLDTVTDPAGNGLTAGSRTAAAVELSAGSTADGASVAPGAALYEATATDGGTVDGLVVLLDGSAPLLNDPVCAGIGTSTATCTYDATVLEPVPGAHTFTFVATDDDGNVTRLVRTVTVTVV